MTDSPTPSVKTRTHWVSGVLTLTLAAWVLIAAIGAGRGHELEPIVVGSGVSATRMLSDWHSPLEGTPADTEVLVFDSGVEGGRVLVICGTHPNEPASIVTGALLAENALAEAGRLYVIPRANASGFTHGDPQEAYPQRFSIRLPDGSDRWFRHGSRFTNPVDQWPDPNLHISPAGQILAGVDSRNLNRCYPGRRDGVLTEQLAWAISQLIESEDIDLVVDVHEASPEYPTVNVMVYHERAEELAAIAKIMLEDEYTDFHISAEPSPVNLRGLSHRELGDALGVPVILLESANPSQGRLKGRTHLGQVVDGQDAAYQLAIQLQQRIQGGNGESNRRLIWAPPYDTVNQGYPIEVRVARHLAVIEELMKWMESDRGPVAVTGLPSYGDFVENGVGPHLVSLASGLDDVATAGIMEAE